MIKDSRKYKRYQKIKEQRCKSVAFADLRKLLEWHDWVCSRVKGSHHIFEHPSAMEILSIPKDGNDVKAPYCRKALRAIEEIEEYD